jgi:hypothetical protein
MEMMRGISTWLRTTLALPAPIVLALSACGNGGDPVQATLEAIVKAANARDAKALFQRVAPGFQAADGSGFAEAQSTVERYFAAYETLDVSIRDVQIERAEGAARVRLRATLSGQPRRIGGLDGLVPSSAAYDFDLRLVPEGGAWKVSWAQWNPANPGDRNH